MKRTILAAAATALAATTTLLTGQAAQAESLGGWDGVRYTRTSTSVPASGGEPTEARGVATCPSGWLAVGGGHTIRSGPGRGIAAGARLNHGQWFARAWQANSGASSLTTYGVCLRTSDYSEEDQTEHELATGPLTMDQSGSCPGGRVVSGGVTYGGADAEDFTLNSSYPVDDVSDSDTVPDDGWRGRGHYTGSGGDSASTFLICLPRVRPTYQRASVTVAPGRSMTTQATCPPGREVLGGGVRASAAGNASHVIDSRPFDSRDRGTVPEDGWRGGITNTSAGNVTTTVYAVCR